MIHTLESIPTRARKPFLPIALSLAALLGFALAGCGTDDEEEATVKIESPANGATVTGPEVLVRVRTTHFSFAGAAAAKSSATEHGGVEGGHIHLFVDKPAGLDADAVPLTKYDTTTLVLAAGSHYIIAVGAAANHEDVESMRDSVSFTVTVP